MVSVSAHLMVDLRRGNESEESDEECKQVWSECMIIPVFSFFCLDELPDLPPSPPSMCYCLTVVW